MPIVNSSVVLPVAYSSEIFRGILGRSKALELGRRLPDMVGKTTKLNVLENLPIAYWVKNMSTPDGAADEIKNKPITELAWKGVDLVAEEIAAIIPVSINTLRDVEDYIQIIPQITEQVEAAFAQVIDSAVFFGTNAPWTGYNGIVADATTAGATVSWDGQNGTSFYAAVSDAMSYVEESGFMPDAILGAPSLRGAYRKTITTLGVVAGDQGEVGALPRHFDFTGGFNTGSAFAIVGDFKQLVYAFRQEMEMKLLQEATLVDPSTGTARYHLAQQDMVAFRFTLRLGAALPNPITRVGGEASGEVLKQKASAYPFAVITKAAQGSN